MNVYNRHMIETLAGMEESAWLRERMQLAQIDLAEHTFEAAKLSLTALRKSDPLKTSEKYGERLQKILDDLAQSYWLAYESADRGAEKPHPNRERANSVIHGIGIFCQENQWKPSVVTKKISGRRTVDVRIDTTPPTEI